MMSELAGWLETHAIDSRMQRPFEAHLKKLFRDSKFLKLAATLINDDVKFDVRNRNFPFQTIQEKDGKNKDALEGVIEEAAAEEDHNVDFSNTLIGHDYSKLEKSWFKLSGSQIDFFFVVVSDVEGVYTAEEYVDESFTETRAERRQWEYENKYHKNYYASVKRVAARFASSFDFDAGHIRIVLQRSSASRSSCVVVVAAKHPVFQHNGVWFEDAAQAIDSVLSLIHISEPTRL